MQGREEFANLPRKLNICISSTRDDFPHTHINDLGYEAVRHPDTGEVRRVGEGMRCSYVWSRMWARDLLATPRSRTWGNRSWRDRGCSIVDHGIGAGAGLTLSWVARPYATRRPGILVWRGRVGCGRLAARGSTEGCANEKKTGKRAQRHLVGCLRRGACGWLFAAGNMRHGVHVVAGNAHNHSGPLGGAVRHLWLLPIRADGPRTRT